MSRSIKAYSQDYRKKCFDSWYLAGRPNMPEKIKQVIPPDEDGRIPSTAVLRRWIVDGMWDEWADTLDAKAIQISDTQLINKKAEMLIRHQEDAKVIAEEALSYLKEKGFDSANSAVSGYFKATEEQRKTAGFSDLLERLDKMCNNDVEQEIINKLRRIQENDQIVEVDAEDISGEDTEEEESQG